MAVPDVGQRARNRRTGPVRTTRVPRKYGRDAFRVWLLRPKKKAVRIDHMVEGFSWTEPRDSAIITGTLTVRPPENRERAIVILSGHRVRIEHAPFPTGRFTPILELRIYSPSQSAAGLVGSLELRSDLALLEQSEDDFKFTRGIRHPKGWRTDQIVSEVCRRYGIKHLPLPKGKHYVKKKVYTDASPLTVINEAYLAERKNTGRRFVIRFALGRLSVTPLRRSSSLLMLGPSLVEAAITETPKEEFATAVTVRGVTESRKGKDAKGRKKVKHGKIALKVQSAPSVARYGFVHRIVHALDADSPAEARTLALRYLADKAKPVKSLTLTHPGIPTIRRGDALRLALPTLGLKQVVWVAEVTHTVGADAYSMDVTCTFDDPYVDEKAQRIVDQLDSTAIERGRVTDAEPKEPAKPEGAANKETAKIAPAPEQTLGEKLTARGSR